MYANSTDIVAGVVSMVHRNGDSCNLNVTYVVVGGYSCTSGSAKDFCPAAAAYRAYQSMPSSSAPVAPDIQSSIDLPDVRERIRTMDEVKQATPEALLPGPADLGQPPAAQPRSHAL